MKANLVLKNGIIQTMVGDERVEALAARDGVIIYLGSNEGVKEYEDEATVIDLEGRYVTPGFIDGHTHDVGRLIQEEEMCYFDKVPADLEEYKKAFKAFLEAHPDNTFYLGHQLDMNAFPNSFVNNEWLNELCPDKPIMITDMSGHCNLFNKAGMEVVGLSDASENPPGGNIYKYPDGRATGYVADCDVYKDAFPKLDKTPEKFKKAFLKFQDICNSYGITAFDDAGPAIEPADVWKILDDMRKNGELKLRANVTSAARGKTRPEDAREMVKLLNEHQYLNSDWLKISQVKHFIDGVPEGHSAYLLEPYAPEAGEAPDYKGTCLLDPEELKEFVRIVNEAGYQVQIHAMGDGGVKVSLDAYEYSEEANGPGDYRNIIAHVTLITRDDIDRMARLKVFGAMQPLWWYYDPNFSPLEEQAFGTERFRTEYNMRTMFDAGVKVTGSMDYPVQPDFRPLAGIQVGATQASPYPGQWDDPKYTRNADQAVTVREMLEVYTVNGAKQMRMEDKIGSLEIGKKADLVVLENDLLNCDVHAISTTKVVYTIVDGKVVYKG